MGKHRLTEAVEGFLSIVVNIRPKDIAEAAEQFIEVRKPLTVAKEGKRSQLSRGYAYNANMWPREFASSFPGHAVCDLTSDHLALYFGNYGTLSAKNRNERRKVVRMFLKWSVRKDCLRADNLLLEADCMATEKYEPDDIAFYTATELRAMLGRASQGPGPPQEGQELEADYTKPVPIITLVALGGVGLQEAVRLTWEDVFYVAGHVEMRGFGQEPLLFLTNVTVKPTRRCLWWVVRGYLTRWPAEETIRFIKQSYRFEDLRVLDYERLRNLAALVIAAAYFAAVWLGQSLKLAVLASGVSRLAKRSFGVPELHYHALADGIGLLRSRLGRCCSLRPPAAVPATLSRQRLFAFGYKLGKVQCCKA